MAYDIAAACQEFIMVGRETNVPDECLRRGITDPEHHDSGKRLRNYRDCAISKLSGRVYNAPGDGDVEMDAGTVYANVMLMMRRPPAGKNQWSLITIVCFADPDINGDFYNEAEYGALFGLAPNIKYASEAADTAFAEARTELKRKLEEKKKQLAIEEKGCQGLKT